MSLSFCVFLTSLITFILGLKFFCRKQTGRGHGRGGSGVLFWEGRIDSCSVTDVLRIYFGIEIDLISWLDMLMKDRKGKPGLNSWADRRSCLLLRWLSQRWESWGRSLILSILSKVRLCKTLQLRRPLGSWVWVLNSDENSGFAMSVQRASSVMILF